jgi:hypothetical protein
VLQRFGPPRWPHNGCTGTQHPRLGKTGFLQVHPGAPTGRFLAPTAHGAPKNSTGRGISHRGGKESPKQGPGPAGAALVGALPPPPQQRCFGAGPHPPRGPKWHWACSGAAHKPPKWQGGGHQAPGSFGGRPGALFTLLLAWPKRAEPARPPKRHPALNPAAWRPGSAQRGRRRAPAPPR